MKSICQCQNMYMPLETNEQRHHRLPGASVELACIVMGWKCLDALQKQLSFLLRHYNGTFSTGFCAQEKRDNFTSRFCVIKQCRLNMELINCEDRNPFYAFILFHLEAVTLIWSLN